MAGAVTLKDVAREAGVHYSTASRALDPRTGHLVNSKTAARIHRAATKLGYRRDMVARSLRVGATMTIGVVVPDLANPAWAPLLHGVATYLERRGYEALIGETQDDNDRYGRLLDRLARWRVDAIISAATRLSDRPMLKKFIRNRLPVVLAVRSVPGSRLPTVTDDGAKGGALAAQHLAALGHKVVAQLEGPADVLTFSDRASGFRLTAKESGMAVQDRYPRAQAPTYQEGFRLMQELLRSDGPTPTGVFVHNDLMAIGAIDAITAAGLECPGDVSIIGYNDSAFVDHLHVPLSTVRFFAKEIGDLAAESAMRMLDHPDAAPISVAVPPVLVPRSSTGPALTGRSADRVLSEGSDRPSQETIHAARAAGTDEYRRPHRQWLVSPNRHK